MAGRYKRENYPPFLIGFGDRFGRFNSVVYRFQLVPITSHISENRPKMKILNILEEITVNTISFGT